MKVLIACEESQEVCNAFRARGHEAYSADIQECSGGHPEWHIFGDVLPVLNGNCVLHFQDGTEKYMDGRWDLVIAHPPCTDLAVSGARHFAKKREDGRQQRSIDFFMNFTRVDCDRIAIENPVCIMSTIWRKPDQIIQPWQFGHPYTKSTCLWLKGLPKLMPTKILEKPSTGWVNQSFTKYGKYGSFNGRFNDAKTRSRTFHGIAEAMAEQWG